MAGARAAIPQTRLSISARFLFVFCILVILAAPTALAAEETSPFPTVAVGYEFSESIGAVTPKYPLPVPDPNATAKHPLAWRLEVFWGEVEREKGRYDWDAVEALVDRFRKAGHEPVVCLWGGNSLYTQEILTPPWATDQAAFRGWEEFVRSAARRFRGKVRHYEVWRTPNVPGLWPGPEAAREYAYLLKRTATILRGEGGKPVIILMGGLAGPDVAFLGKLFEEGIGPYVDIVPVRPDPAKDVEAQIRVVADFLAGASPSTAVWAMGLVVPQAPAETAVGEACRVALGAFAAGAKVATFALPLRAADGARRGWPERADALVRLHSVLTPGLGLLPETRARIVDAMGNPIASARTITFFDADEGVAVVAYYIAPPGGGPQQATAVIDARRPGPPILYDPVAGSQSQPEFVPVEKGMQGPVDLRSYPLFLLYKEGVGQQAVEGLEKGPESVSVTAERGMTAEEVISKHQEVAARQQAVLKNYDAKGLVQFHFSLAGASERFDVAMGGQFFYEASTGPEWEFTDYYINGNRSPWKKFPELPLIQPEKVVTLPLDITLDRAYGYEMVGEDRAEEKDCWVLSFEPVDPEKSLYRGKVWIDKETYNKVRTAVTQTRLETPFVSNEERDTYGPVPSGDGGEVWLLKRIDGQQIYTTVGRNFIVLREVTFEDFVVNGAEFDQRRKAAYSSEHQMLRETDKGFRYLVKDDEGNRQVKTDMDKNQLFGLAGVFYDGSLDYPLPLLGVNYFDYDFRGKGIQTNVFFAGALVMANATKPDLLGTRYEVGVDLFAMAVAFTDRGFETGLLRKKSGSIVSGSDEQLDELDVSNRSQHVAFNFGHALGDFAKVRLSVGLTRQNSGRTDDTYEDDPDEALKGGQTHFIVPADVWERSYELTGNYDRSGYSVDGSISFSSRSQWPFWGCPPGLLVESDKDGTVELKPRTCGRQGVPLVPDWSPDAEDFSRYQVGASKEWHLPYFQKVRGELDWLGGHDLDRFSRYQFSFFGETSLRGFSGRGVRFDDGIIARANYAFNIGQVVQFDASLDHARVRDLSSSRGFADHTGIGVSGKFLGPWETILRFDVGYSLASDIPAAEGKAEALFLVLKLF